MNTTKPFDRILENMGLSEEARKRVFDFEIASNPGEPVFWKIKILATPEEISELDRLNIKT